MSVEGVEKRPCIYFWGPNCLNVYLQALIGAKGFCTFDWRRAPKAPNDKACLENGGDCPFHYTTDSLEASKK